MSKLANSDGDCGFLAVASAVTTAGNHRGVPLVGNHRGVPLVGNHRGVPLVGNHRGVPLHVVLVHAAIVDGSNGVDKAHLDGHHIVGEHQAGAGIGD
jgi:hypothetical protein